MNLFFAIYGLFSGIYFVMIGDLVILAMIYILYYEELKLSSFLRYILTLLLVLFYAIVIWLLEVKLLSIILVSITPFIFFFLIKEIYKPFYGE